MISAPAPQRQSVPPPAHEVPQPIPTQTNNNSNVKNEIVDEIADVDIADNKAGGKEDTGKNKLDH